MLTLLSLCSMGHAMAQGPETSADERARATLSQMTLDEKLDMLTGVDGFNLHSLDRFGLPKLIMSDGPVGVRNFGPTTAYPAGICLASTFNPKLANDFGTAIGRDARSRGVHIWLGPGVNLSRIPQNGRDFEYLGEDPFLSSKIVAPIVRGVQSQGVVATVKHYAANNHENDRMVDSSNVDERVLRELYFKPFEAAVREGGAWAVMCAYNKVNGTYCSENPFLLTDVLKHDWAFKGIVMSDWGAVHSTLPALNAGLDLEMPGGEFFTQDKIKPYLENGQLSMTMVNDKVERILRMEYAMGFDKGGQTDSSIPKDDPHNELTALEVAREGTVLLKNRDHVLPLDPHRVRHILVVGPNADPAVTGGGGSAYTTPAEKVSLLEAVKKVAGPNVEVHYKPLYDDLMAKAFLFRGYRMPDDPNRPGLREERFDNMDLSGAPKETARSRGVNMNLLMADGKPIPEHFSRRWTGTVQFDRAGTYLAMSRSDDGIRVFLDDQKIIDDWSDHGATDDTAEVHVEANRRYKLRVEYYNNEGDAIAQFGFSPEIEEHIDKDLPMDEIRNADAVVAAVGFNPATESEGQDRPFDLPVPQQILLHKLEAATSRLIVVNNSGAGVNMMGWHEGAAGIVQAWYPGGIGNLAIAEILFGAANPSGKLAVTFPRTLKGTYYETAYPPHNHNMDYKEGLFIGYRWFDKNNAEPLYPFGFGLSYTSFRMDHTHIVPDMATDTARVVTVVRNTGERPGAETVQVYVGMKDSHIPRAVRELKGFQKVFLRPGESKEVMIPVHIPDLAYFDTPHHRWAIEPGHYEISVGTSSRDLPFHRVMTVGASAK